MKDIYVYRSKMKETWGSTGNIIYTNLEVPLEAHAKLIYVFLYS